MAKKRQKFKKYSLNEKILIVNSWHALLKKETLYNNNITSLQEYIQLVEDWIIFYNTARMKSKNI